MTSIHRVRLAECLPQPWRNGSGLTRELLRWPLRPMAARADAADSDWTLRISVAEIGRDGPFSPFPGVERWFAVLQGHGVQLALPQGERRLAPGDAPLSFAGEAAPGCRLVDGPTQDLNLMQRRGCGRSRMWCVQAGSTVEGPTRWRGLYAHERQRIVIGGEAQVVEAGTLLWSDEPGAWPWRTTPAGGEGHAGHAGLAYWMELRA